MSIFEEVKEHLGIQQVIEHYGYEMNKGGFICCPFHSEKTPSCKIYTDTNTYHCFGCGQHGDIIDFAAHELGKDKFQAAKQLAEDFGLSVDTNYVPKPNPEPEPIPKKSDNPTDSVFKLLMQAENLTSEKINAVKKILSDGKSKKTYSLDDTGNAERLYELYGAVLRYSYIDRKWLYYADGKWNYDNIGYSRSVADEAVERMQEEEIIYSELDEKNGTDMTKQFQKHCKKSRSCNSKTNMLHEFEHYNPIVPSMLDRNKFYLNCKNGIVDLKSCELMPHDREALMTKMADCEYDFSSTKPEKWLEFLDTVFNHDRDLIRYVQKAVGYSLSGSTSEQCAFFLYGTGSNGKSTFLEVIRSILGDYATNIQPQTIMIKPVSSGATGDIARLKGARFVTSVEPNEGMRIDEGLLKQLTGDDIITARKLYGEEFEFKPEFKLWIATNHKPVIRGTDTGIWRRIHLIPFTVHIPDDKKDKHLKEKLAEEFPAILSWAVKGFQLWLDEGLEKPETVMQAVSEYRHEMDIISAFIDSCCTAGGEIKSSELYIAYAKWADENNEYKMSNTKFGAEMQKRYKKEKKRNANFYIGISLETESYSTSIG